MTPFCVLLLLSLLVLEIVVNTTGHEQGFSKDLQQGQNDPGQTVLSNMYPVRKNKGCSLNEALSPS